MQFPSKLTLQGLMLLDELHAKETLSAAGASLKTPSTKDNDNLNILVPLR